MPSMGGSFDPDSDFPVSFGQVQSQRPTQLISVDDSTSSIQKPKAAPSDSSSVPASSLAAASPSPSALPTTNPSGASAKASSAAAITSDYAPFSIDSDDEEGDDEDDDDDDGDDHHHEEYHSMEFLASSEHEGGGDGGDDSDSDTPSNELLLGTAFCTFMSFAVIQSFFAVLAGSKAMMGDSAAMLVDALTYFFNWIAERRKRRFDERYRLFDADASEEQHPQQLQQDPVRARRIRERSKRKMVLQLEIFPPCLSVSTLMIVTGVVMQKSIKLLVLDMHRDSSEQLRPNVNMMMAFSIFNLALDGLNVFCFARAKHLLGYSTIVTATAANSKNATATHTAGGVLHDDDNNDGMERGSLTLNLEEGLVTSTPPTTAGNCTGIPRQQDWRLPKPTGSTYRQVSGRECSESEGGGDDAIIQEHDAVTVTASSNTSSRPVVQAGTNGNGMRNPGDSLHNNHDRQNQHHHHHDNHFDHEEEEEAEHANLNMCSAYTHVFADTLRSIAVIIASVIADVVDSVTPEEADAAAAVVVSILVLLSMVPLFHGLVQSVSELRAILREEESEKMFPGHVNATTEST